jgi:predicted HTH transcriptional regulator
MNKKDARRLIKAGEGIDREFKRKFSSPEKIAKELIAFANTRGGYLFFGVDDDGSIRGVESEKGEAELATDAATNYCEPPVEHVVHFLELEGKEVVVVETPESKTKPHRIQDYLDDVDVNVAAIYVRVNDKSVLASKEMVRLLRASRDGKPLIRYRPGDLESHAFTLLEKREEITADDLKQSANVSARRASRTLVKMARAGLLLVHAKENGETYFTQAG